MYANCEVLVTGGAGFLGGNVARTLASTAKHVWVLDDLFTGHPSAVPPWHNITFVHGSVCDASLLQTLLARVDYVFHFAARNISLSVEQPDSDFHVNVEGTHELLLQARPFRERIRRIIYASSSSLYGDSPVIPTPESGYDVSTPYAATKFAGELLCVAYGKTFGLPVTCLRYSNVFGPGQVSENPYCGVVTKFMDAIYERVPFTIFGDGTQTRDFTYVEDAVEATLLAGSSGRTAGGVFNVGTGRETSVNELANLVSSAIGEPGYPRTYSPKRPVDTIFRRCIDAVKIRETTGWVTKHSLEDGLSKTWRWFNGRRGCDSA